MKTVDSCSSLRLVSRPKLFGGLLMVLTMGGAEVSAAPTARPVDPCAAKQIFEVTQKSLNEAQSKVNQVPYPKLLDLPHINEENQMEKAREKMGALDNSIENLEFSINLNGYVKDLAQAQALLKSLEKNKSATDKTEAQKKKRLAEVEAELAQVANGLTELRKKPGYKQIGQVAAIKKTIAVQEDVLRGKMPDVPLDDTAQVRSAARTVELTNPKIEGWREEIKPLEIVETVANKAKIQQYEALIAEEVRKEREALLGTISSWAQTKAELAEIDPKGDISDLWAEAQAYKKALVEKSHEKESLISPETPGAGKDQVIYEKAKDNVKVLEELRDLQAKKVPLEKWYLAQTELDEVKVEHLRAKADYDQAVQDKNALLAEAKATFQSEEARIQAIKATLMGKPRDADFYKKLRDLRDHGLKTYKPLQTRLDKFDCYDDASSFNENKLSPRIRVLEKIVIASHSGNSNGGTVLGHPVKPTRPIKPPTPPAQKVVEWVRQEPLFMSDNTVGRMPLHMTVAKTSLTYTTTRDGKEWTNTMTWTEPPAVIKQNQTVTLTMNSTSQEGWANVGGWWNIRNIPKTEGVNGVGSSAGWRSSSPHQGTLTFKAVSLPQIEVSAGHDPAPNTWIVIIWKYALRK